MRGFLIVVRPEKKMAFTWSTIVDKVTLNDFKSYVFEYYPQYAHDKYLENIRVQRTPQA